MPKRTRGRGMQGQLVHQLNAMAKGGDMNLRRNESIGCNDIES
jgi:hypothetical protein